MKSEKEDSKATILDTDEDIEPFLSDQPDKQDEQIQELTRSLASERDGRKEERLLWILISVILLNITFFSSMESILGPVIIGLLQIIALTVIAQRLGLQEIVIIINRFVSFVANATKLQD